MSPATHAASPLAENEGDCATYQDPMVAFVAECDALVLDTIENTRQYFEHKLADLANRIAALTNENQALRLILENPTIRPNATGA
jgi:hypothetical protein